VSAQNEQASFLHRDTTGDHLRRNFNNILSLQPDASSDRSITFSAIACLPGPTDGNVYHRIGLATGHSSVSNTACGRSAANESRHPTSRQAARPDDPANIAMRSGQPPTGRAGGDPNAVLIRNRSLLFRQSKSQYPPGYEANSIAEDPRFAGSSGGVFHETDDLRLSNDSPAIGAGVVLPDDLHILDPFAPADGHPDIGCYPLGACPLQVGVDSRRSYPIE
jgi:hypothetical protein